MIAAFLQPLNDLCAPVAATLLSPSASHHVHQPCCCLLSQQNLLNDNSALGTAPRKLATSTLNRRFSNRVHVAATPQQSLPKDRCHVSAHKGGHIAAICCILQQALLLTTAPTLQPFKGLRSPRTAASLQSLSSPCSTMRAAAASGSANAASWSRSSAGTTCRLAAGTETYSARQPSRLMIP